MTTTKQESPARPGKKPSRSERLAAELRANLRRRKAQQTRARRCRTKHTQGRRQVPAFLVMIKIDTPGDAGLRLESGDERGEELAPARVLHLGRGE